eukprot:gnl/Spiro4/323_TR203_c0_g1_i1.p4 gnl/Spiro4/323_TR203_c0_g1~~gnl/Spiro4/323_TR203_c0_g1_i1.p4  ORF type:complete len:108 (-),score=31.95 gnl/Spiro4/323_TR203_c0_g1_i1:155-478(-)
MALANLPNQGNFTRGRKLSGHSAPSLYICTHNTNPPADQVISTDAAPILIRSLVDKRKREEKKQHETSHKGADTKKRPAERSAADEPAAKRSAPQSPPPPPAKTGRK